MSVLLGFTDVLLAGRRLLLLGVGRGQWRLVGGGVGRVEL